jgi:uncharacterized protein (DUF433 family)
MRVTVGAIMGLLASGQAQGEILAAYPYLEPEDLHAALMIMCRDEDGSFDG